MAKKSTLKDLNSFLNQQPKRLDSESDIQPSSIDLDSVQAIAKAINEITKDSGLEASAILSTIIEEVYQEKKDKSPEDYLLLNSAAYLNAKN
ncbi:hypothetical protein OO013_13200 [Mangrovivirga sp. M17]|uniref:Uncharacterized protein n=1 Tax=Mangrovivirga halotolerans TaxID=2993936 RepID=A0ABT3RU12_9BACT|nr:hypothetical protein [Mangrovivirga halotolerans]MCX2744834.1 hypothetical protein [Mangrovivirga halotolerans]